MAFRGEKSCRKHDDGETLYDQMLSTPQVALGPVPPNSLVVTSISSVSILSRFTPPFVHFPDVIVFPYILMTFFEFKMGSQRPMVFLETSSFESIVVRQGQIALIVNDSVTQLHASVCFISA